MIFVFFFSNTALTAFKLGVTSVSLSCALSAVMIYGNVITLYYTQIHRHAHMIECKSCTMSAHRIYTLNQG